MLSPFSHVCLCETLWTVACQAPLSMGFSRREYKVGLPNPPPGDLPNLGIEPMSPAILADSLPLSHLRSPATRINTVLLGALTESVTGAGPDLPFHRSKEKY